MWDQNIAELAASVGPMVSADLFAEANRGGRRYIAGRGPLFDARIAAGKVRDGHGDLLANDIFCLEDGPRILDCLDFDERLRHGDVIADVAFLAMDLEHLGSAGAAVRFLSDYREFARETYPESLMDFYIAHRALVRAKVASLSIRQGSQHSSDEPLRLVRLALRHLRRGRVRIVLVGGLPGTGKSTLATALAGEMGWAVLSSDEVRKDIVGLGHLQPAPAQFREGIYSPVVTEAVYEELIARARRLASHGESVVIDASWIDAKWRRAASDLASETESDLLQLACVTPRGVADRRLLARGQHKSTSDATPSVAAAMAKHSDPWPDALVIEGAQTPATMLQVALEAVADRREGLPVAPRLQSR